MSDSGLLGWLSRLRSWRLFVVAGALFVVDVLVPDQEGDTVLLHEVYDDQAAFDTHMETPHMKAYREDTSPMVADRRRTLCRLDAG